MAVSPPRIAPQSISASIVDAILFHQYNQNINFLLHLWFHRDTFQILSPLSHTMSYPHILMCVSNIVKFFFMTAPGSLYTDYFSRDRLSHN